MNAPHPLGGRVIARQSASAGATEVLAPGHELLFADGHTLTLHSTRANGAALRTHRAVMAPAGNQLLLVDLQRLLPSEIKPLPGATDGEISDAVHRLLRSSYPSAARCLAAAMRHALGSWWPVGGGWVWYAAARSVDYEPLMIAAAEEAQSGGPKAP